MVRLPLPASLRSLPVDGGLLALTFGTLLLVQNAPQNDVATTASNYGPTVTTASHGGAAHVTPGLAATSAGGVTFSGQLDRRRVLQGSDGVVQMELVLRAEERAARLERVPTDLIVVLDKSGSMGGEKIDAARESVVALVDMLGPDDRFGLVTYDSAARVTIPIAAATSDRRQAWCRTARSVDAGGSTNMSDGMDLAHRELAQAELPGRAARVILISDGLPNRGDATHSGLLRRASQAARDEFVLTAVGVGDDFNEHLMTGLADAGTGNYYYLQNSYSLAEVFAGEFRSAGQTIASGLEVHIRPGPGVVVEDAAGLPLERRGDIVVFKLGAIHSGQERSLWVTMRSPAGRTGSLSLGDVSLNWSNDDGRQVLGLSEQPQVECVASAETYYEGVDKDRWTQSVVKEQYNKLRTEVSKAVQQGRKDEAKQAIQAYQQEVSAANAYVGSAAVTGNLQELEALDDEVDEAFSGEGQAKKRNTLSKGVSKDAWDMRQTR